MRLFVPLLVLASLLTVQQLAQGNPLVLPTRVAPAARALSSAAASSSSSVSIPASYPDGGITITQPPQTGAASYYPIASGELITFGWNFTYVLSKPQSILVSALCSENGNTYDLAGPTGIPGSATQFVWDVYNYSINAQKSNLPALNQASYTLVVRDPSVTALQPGRMAENTHLTFALYNPQSYTPMPQWSCAECNSGATGSLVTSPMLLTIALSFLAMVLGGGHVLARIV